MLRTDKGTSLPVRQTGETRQGFFSMDLRYAIYAQEDDGKLVRIFKDMDWQLEVEAWQYVHGSRKLQDRQVYTVVKIMVG